MLIKYTFHLKSRFRAEDHWPIRGLGGQVRLVENDGIVSAIEISLPGQPITLAPKIEATQHGEIRSHIIFRDGQLFERTEQNLRRAFAHIQCFFPIELALEKGQTEFIAESEDERGQIELMSFSRDLRELTPMITFDMVARAFWAGDAGHDPSFVATLLVAARNKLNEKEFIDSFRYSFLFIEGVFGQGKFKTESLKRALKGNDELRGAIQKALKSIRKYPLRHKSSTRTLIEKQGDVDSIIDEMVEKRGLYFHANLQRKDGWKPHDQRDAEALALLCSLVLTTIATNFAGPMFQDEFVQRFELEAREAEANVTLKIEWKYREGDVQFDRVGNIQLNFAGTKVTPRNGGGGRTVLFRKI